MSDQNTAITTTALSRMLSQFEGSANLRLLAASYLDQVQALEDAAWPILAERSIANATGDRLDGFGEIFSLSRAGRNDADYRLVLQAELAILQSNGTETDLLTVVQLLLQMTIPDYEFVEYFPKTVYLRPVNFVLTDDPVVIGAQLKRAVSAATQLWLVYSEQDDTKTFQLSSQGATVETSNSLGLANVAQSSGGYLAGVV